MKRVVVLISFATSLCAAASTASQPIRSGQYNFLHRFAEQPNIAGTPVTVKIKGHHITVINNTQSDGFPKGIIADGTLMWHATSKQWIIGTGKTDHFAKEVGGCSAVPEIVDLQNMIYWSC